MIEDKAIQNKSNIFSPSISASHLISNGRIAKTLAIAGHEVVSSNEIKPNNK